MLLSTGQSRSAWEGIKSIMGMQSTRHPIFLSGKSALEFPNDFDIF